jgi:hypothetical protein
MAYLFYNTNTMGQNTINSIVFIQKIFLLKLNMDSILPLYSDINNLQILLLEVYLLNFKHHRMNSIFVNNIENIKKIQ